MKKMRPIYWLTHSENGRIAPSSLVRYSMISCIIERKCSRLPKWMFRNAPTWNQCVCIYFTLPITVKLLFVFCLNFATAPTPASGLASVPIYSNAKYRCRERLACGKEPTLFFNCVLINVKSSVSCEFQRFNSRIGWNRRARNIEGGW